MLKVLVILLSVRQALGTKLHSDSSSIPNDIKGDDKFEPWKVFCDVIAPPISPDIDFTKSSPIAVLSEEQVCNLIEHELSLGAVARIEDYSKGQDQKVWLAWTSTGNDVVVKQPKEDRMKLFNENYGCAVATSLGIPAPKILHLTSDVLVQTMVPGTQVAPGAVSTRPLEVYFELGKHLRRIHSVSVPYHGAPGESVFSALVEEIPEGHPKEELDKLFQSTRIRSVEEQAITREYFKRCREKFVVNSKRTPVLLHGDIHDGNFLSHADTKTVSGIIDWADIGGGLPEEDFCVPFSIGMNLTHFNAMLEGYGRDAAPNIDMIKYFAALRLIAWIPDGPPDVESMTVDLRDRLDIFRRIVGLPQLRWEHIYQN